MSLHHGPSNTRRTVHIIMGLIVCALTAYAIHLGWSRTIYLWDESIYANNSLEMYLNRNYLVYTTNSRADHFNSKPPLVLWLQAGSYALFGLNEFAVRFPTFLALAGVLLLCIVYSRKLTGSVRAGLVACMTLLVANGMMRSHVFLSGDLDGVLVFFTTFLFLHHLKIIQRKQATRCDIYTYASLFVLAYLTKSTAVFLILPSLFISLLLNKQLKQIVWRRATLISIAFFAVTIIGYYVIREHYDPGYWGVVWYSEFTRISVNIQPWVAYPWNVYFLFLWERFFHYPLLLLAIIGPVYLVLPASSFRKLFLHALVMALVYLAFITIPPVKLEWYDAPAYPLIALAIGIALSELLRLVFSRLQNAALRESLSALIILGLLCGAGIPFRRQLLNELGSFQQQEESTNALRIIAATHPEIKRLTVMEDYLGPNYAHLLDGLLFYQKILKQRKRTTVSIVHTMGQVAAGDTVIICNQERTYALGNQYAASILDSCRSCKWIRYEAKNPQP